MKGRKKQMGNDACTEIVPGLWIGSLASLKTIDNDIMVRRRWQVISLLGDDKLISLSNFFITSSSTLVGCHHDVWKLSDSFQGMFLSERLISALNIIDNSTPSLTGDASSENRACLVHCAQGISRSSALCAAWLISRKKMSLQDALAQIRNARSEISPNLGFLASLRALEQCDGDVRKAIERMQEKVR